jgi:hypothetical protein
MSGEKGKRVLTNEMVQLLNDHCTISQIQELLGEAKSEGAKVNKTAQDKETLVSENLRTGVARGDIAIGKVFELLADCEENDAQYHFFFQVNPKKKAALSNFSEVGKLLLGDNWQEKMRFPAFLAKPHGEQWGDFREENGGWLAKLYRGDHRWVVDKAETKYTATRRVKVWVLQYMREVWIARWWPRPSLIEFCFPRLASRNEQNEALAAMWSAVQKVIHPSDADNFAFDKAATKIVHDESSLDGQIHLGGLARLKSPDGGATIMIPRSSEQSLLGSDDRREALKHYHNCEELGVFWVPTTATDAVAERVKTVLGSMVKHAILFTAKNRAKTVRYVTQRLIDLEIDGRRN